MSDLSLAGLPTTFCWRLAGQRGPPLRHALRFGEAVRAAVMRAGNRIGMARLPDTFHGGRQYRGHGHAYWLSEDRDRDGYIDHFTVHAHSGLRPEVVAALAGAGFAWLNERVVWTLVPVSLGRPRSGGVLGPARRWTAATPYVTPQHRTDPEGTDRPELTPEAQLRREIEQRGLPPPLSIAWCHAIALCGSTIEVPRFVRTSRGRRAPPGAWLGAQRSCLRNPSRARWRSDSDPISGSD